MARVAGSAEGATSRPAHAPERNLSYFHEEQRFRQPSLWLLLGLIALGVGLPVVLAPRESTSIWSAVVGIVVVALVWVLFAATELVVDVDKDAVTIRFLYLWPARRVPLADIATIESVRYRPLLDYLGYGVRFGPKGLAYNVSGDRGVKIRLRDGGSFLVGSQRPDELADAIGRAKAARE